MSRRVKFSPMLLVKTCTLALLCLNLGCSQADQEAPLQVSEAPAPQNSTQTSASQDTAATVSSKMDDSAPSVTPPAEETQSQPN